MTDAEFDSAANTYQERLSDCNLTNDEIAEVYALFNQAKNGDESKFLKFFIIKKNKIIEITQSEGHDELSRMKFEAWIRKKGLPSVEAKTQYINLIESLKTKYL